MTTTRFQQLISQNQAALSTRRKTVNALMLSLTGLLTLLALIPLFWILGFLLPSTDPFPGSALPSKI